MRRIDIVVVVLLLAGIAVSTLQDFGDPRPRRPDPTRPSTAPEANRLPPLTQDDPVFQIQAEPKTTDVSGSAVAISDGVWLTADHVTDSCRSVFLAAETGYLRATEVTAHGRADVAVVQTGRSGPALALSNRLVPGQRGYHYGFPSGEPGEVLTTLIGRASIRVSGARNRREPAVAWAENRRHPPSLDSLGGISGGPVLDRDGAVVGITVGGSARRGTVLTAPPISLQEVLARADVTIGKTDSGDRFGEPASQPLTAYGNALRDAFTVAKVICLAAPRKRRPLAPR